MSSDRVETSSSASSSNSDSQSQNGAAPQEGYPEQKHAGAVGLGPEYGKMHRAVSLVFQTKHKITLTHLVVRQLETKSTESKRSLSEK